MNISFDESLLWVNRAQLRDENRIEALSVKGLKSILRGRALQEVGRVHLWRRLANFPNLDDMFPYVKGFIVAGSPEWLGALQQIYELCLRHSTPIWIVGVGCAQQADSLEMLRKAREKGLVSVITTRDSLAAKFLNDGGVAHKTFIDPAFHATYPTPGEKLYDVVLNYKAAGAGNGVYKNSDDRFFLEIYAKYKNRIDMVTVHEAPEYALAKKLFPDAKVFYNSDYSTYKNIYASTRCYIGARIHGAIPVVANGGKACILRGTSKIDTLIRTEKEMREKTGQTNLVVLTDIRKWNEIMLDELEYDEHVTRAFISKDFMEHSAYIRGHG